MALVDLGRPSGSSGGGLFTDRNSFAASAPAGTTIAVLSNPFAGATTYAAVGGAPGALVLSGSAIVAGGGAAPGQLYAIKVRATSADGAREVAETLTFEATGTMIAATTASASVRARLANGQNVAGGNNVYSWRGRDISNVDVVDPWIEIWNGYVNVGVTAPASPEVPAANAVPYRAALVTGVSGTGSNQSGATVTPLTWNAAYAGTAGSIWKLDGTTPTAADLSAAIAAGTLALADNGRQLRLPPGWRARTDPATGLTIARRTPYFWQLEDAPATGEYRVSQGTQPRGELGDLMRAGSTSGQYVYTGNWSGASASGSQMLTPVLVGGTSQTGARTVGVTGDSITMEVRDSAYGSSAMVGDGDQALAYALRALNAAGYAFVQTAISGDKASIACRSVAAGNGGMAQRELSLRFASAILSGMGHNDRGLLWTGAAPGGFLATYRWWWNRLRAAGVGGAARVVQFDLLPQSSSTDAYVTTANQTSNVGPGSMQYDSFNPWITRSGAYAGVAFDKAAGDPDAGWSINGALYAWATELGLDVDAAHIKWPSTGQPNTPLTTGNAVNYDSTHPKGPAHAGIAAKLAPALPGLVGW